MPPPVENLSDDESSGEAIPYNAMKGAHESDGDKPSENDANDDEEDEEGLYIVEKILGHEFRNGILFLIVKWKGYEDPADQTLEPEENLLEGAKDLVEEYYRVKGGRPEKPQRGKRKSMTGPKETSEKAEPKKRRKPRADATTETGDEDDAELPDWVPRSKNWESEVLNVDTILRDPETSKLIAYLHWKNGKKSKVSLETCYDKCPKKMLKFYEEHLVFKDA
ncbi:hypothetical protein BDV28DRAFT_136653 [Aspergillus coremiiformis]|uniref:Chromo domain-containing protein n=1 Tax=Aspergillus coremiiformis TaxID=138285 RepID=A0A5N6Z1V5_9EURO|nr:hypothetical protein BDV28DRAFT_136653 [Aspergillus coremiiformis]